MPIRAARRPETERRTPIAIALVAIVALLAFPGHEMAQASSRSASGSKSSGANATTPAHRVSAGRPVATQRSRSAQPAASARVNTPQARVSAPARAGAPTSNSHAASTANRNAGVASPRSRSTAVRNTAVRNAVARSTNAQTTRARSATQQPTTATRHVTTNPTPATPAVHRRVTVPASTDATAGSETVSPRSTRISTGATRRASIARRSSAPSSVSDSSSERPSSAAATPSRSTATLGNHDTHSAAALDERPRVESSTADRSPATRDVLRRLARPEREQPAASPGPAVVETHSTAEGTRGASLVVTSRDTEHRVRRHFVRSGDRPTSDRKHRHRNDRHASCFRHPGPWAFFVPGAWSAWCEPWIVVYEMPLSWRALFEDEGAFAYDAELAVEVAAYSSADWIAWFMELGDAFFRAGFYRASAIFFEWAVRLDPDLAGPRFALVDALFATGEYAYAAVVLRVATELDPGWLDLEIDRLAFYGDVDDHALHVASLVDRVRENPYDVAALQLLGYERFFSTAPETSREIWYSVLDEDPHDPLAHAFLEALDRRLLTP